MKKYKLLKIKAKRKYAFWETGIENDTIFKDLPGHYAKSKQKPRKKGRNRHRPIFPLTGQETKSKKPTKSEPADARLTGPDMFLAWVWVWCDGDVKLFMEQREKLFNPEASSPTVDVGIPATHTPKLQESILIAHLRHPP